MPRWLEKMLKVVGAALVGLMGVALGLSAAGLLVPGVSFGAATPADRLAVSLLAMLVLTVGLGVATSLLSLLVGGRGFFEELAGGIMAVVLLPFVILGAVPVLLRVLGWAAGRLGLPFGIAGFWDTILATLVLLGALVLSFVVTVVVAGLAARMVRSRSLR